MHKNDEQTAALESEEALAVGGDAEPRPRDRKVRLEPPKRLYIRVLSGVRAGFRWGALEGNNNSGGHSSGCKP